MKIKFKEIIIKGVELDISPDDIYNLPVRINSDIMKNWLFLQTGGVMIEDENEEGDEKDSKKSNEPPEIKGFNGED